MECLAVLFHLLDSESLRSALPADLNADAWRLQFNVRISVLVLASVGTTLCPDLVMVAVSGFDAILLTDRPHTFLPTHALGIGLLGDKCNGGQQSGCDHETI
jgi:hypothetical protein